MNEKQVKSLLGVVVPLLNCKNSAKSQLNMCVFHFPLTFCPHKIVSARHVSVPQNILKMHLPLSVESLLHVSPSPEPLSGYCASKCTKNALTALEGDLTTCKPLPRPFSWIWEGREREMKGNRGGKERREREEEGGKGARVGPPALIRH